MSAQLFLSSTDATPMYRQIVDQITARVIAGDWAPGSALPSIRELAAANGVSVITVKRAYLELEHAGVIVTRHGKGSTVAESLDPSRARLQGELLRQIDAVLITAERLGCTNAELQDLIANRRQQGNTP
ncbi:GntR family transcriptional regulator [Inhella inkyongensis]|uniref:GntR family transcriptional regulator n=1 Tax=Inhella inkyongensis TaxID=392593 RepID=A0A840S2E8_9BURK|nr:GntR family transcriptional regulator [Inhella inkyongensis]MBB5203266.1 GntR family transcriptional regulator [Inhella inkyongensis]